MHRVEYGAYKVTCSCGWLFVRPTFRDASRTNKAINKHLKEVNNASKAISD